MINLENLIEDLNQEYANELTKWLDINLSITDIEALSHQIEKQYISK